MEDADYLIYLSRQYKIQRNSKFNTEDNQPGFVQGIKTSGRKSIDRQKGHRRLSSQGRIHYDRLWIKLTGNCNAAGKMGKRSQEEDQGKVII